jgi:hypothetical protein
MSGMWATKYQFLKPKPQLTAAWVLMRFRLETFSFSVPLRLEVK